MWKTKQQKKKRFGYEKATLLTNENIKWCKNSSLIFQGKKNNNKSDNIYNHINIWGGADMTKGYLEWDKKGPHILLWGVAIGLTTLEINLAKLAGLKMFIIDYWQFPK